MPDDNSPKSQSGEKVIPVSDDLMQHLAQSNANPASPKLPDGEKTPDPADTLNSSATQPIGPSQPQTSPQAATGSPPPASPDALNIQPESAPLPTSDTPQSEGISTTSNPVIPDSTPLPESGSNISHFDNPEAASGQSSVQNLNPQPPTAGSELTATTTADLSQNHNETPADSNEINFAPPAQANPEIPADGSSGDNNQPSTTAEQQKFINEAAWGPLFGVWYFVAVNSLKMSLLFLLLPSAVALLVGIVAFVIDFPVLSLFSYVFAAVVYLTLLAYGIKNGRSISWKTHYWPNFESYQDFQKKWSFWAKIYALILLVPLLLSGIAALALLLMNPTDRISEANDTQVQSDLKITANALEACFTDNFGDYTQCDSIPKLTSGSYLSATPSTSIFISTYGQPAEVIAYASANDNSVECQSGEGSRKFYTYDSGSGQTKVFCSDSLPQGPIQ